MQGPVFDQKGLNSIAETLLLKEQALLIDSMDTNPYNKSFGEKKYETEKRVKLAIDFGKLMFDEQTIYKIESQTLKRETFELVFNNINSSQNNNDGGILIIMTS